MFRDYYYSTAYLRDPEYPDILLTLSRGMHCLTHAFNFEHSEFTLRLTRAYVTQVCVLCNTGVSELQFRLPCNSAVLNLWTSTPLMLAGLVNVLTLTKSGISVTGETGNS